jgi:hypothetical protein
MLLAEPVLGRGISGNKAGGPGGLKVVSADRASDVEDFTGEVEPLDDLGTHGLVINFIQADASGNDFTFIENDFFHFANLPELHGLGKDVELFFGDGLGSGIFGDFCHGEKKGCN